MVDIIERLQSPQTSLGTLWPQPNLHEEAADEITRLREENARYKLTYAKYVEATDRMNGAPCEQIRHQQEADALREENARLREALKDLIEEDEYQTCSGEEEDGIVRAAARAAIREGGKDG